MERREQILGAVETLNYRATVGDVATRSGLELTTVQQELNSLAQDGDGHLQVSNTGEIVYAFEADVRDRLLRKDRNARLKALLKKAWQVAFYLVRISFGILLVLSLVLIAIGIYVVLSSRDGDGGGEGESRGGGGGVPNFFWGDFFYIFYWPPYGYYDERRLKDPKDMGFLESVYSFLFGDGNPNADLESRRWRTVAGVIQANRGVVVAEQLAPYLEAARVDSEDFVLPALVKYDGVPEVSEQGEIVYRFPQLQVQAEERRPAATLPGFLQEKRWQFSKAPGGKLVLAGALGVANFVGAWFLYFLLQSTNLPPDLSFFAALAPVLVVYGTLFLLVPAVRAAVIAWLNRGVESRNRSRSGFARHLREANAELRRKLAFAQSFAAQKVLGKEDIIYTTEQSTLEQRDYELDDPRFRSLEDPRTGA
ncbi:hypothetical protein [Gloeobacter morelensis]|uniref:Uncharacterized protein n=1 Tax=Gloeobacter morelensis MG652769 TaxID=2781736 RepID=A0ABY3PNM4_9CYAN|nr:hypothetical protein [Gloeobacter morelensis]UFP95300.1 hypothetical protein ISF26_03345 [Gloeobacter morelensis MG652769]